MNSLTDFPMTHADPLHNLEPCAILKTFSNLLIVNNNNGSNQEQGHKENADKEQAAVNLVKIVPGCINTFRVIELAVRAFKIFR